MDPGTPGFGVCVRCAVPWASEQSEDKLPGLFVHVRGVSPGTLPGPCAVLPSALEKAVPASGLPGAED